MEVEKKLNSSDSSFNNNNSKNEFKQHPLFVRLKLRSLCMVGALLPGIGCYTCLLYTFIFQRERIDNFVTTNCPKVHSSFPPVSYSIGVWEPQKSFWLFVLFIHVQARIFFGVVIFHAIGYALWLISFNFNVLCNTILFYHSDYTLFSLAEYALVGLNSL
uniref:Uncharacterized protein n=1 Tax=Meloidogyne floridensis TaxID=298350 RepID=A0A915PBW0_9BILA